MQSKTKRLVSNTFIFMIGSIGSKFIQFFLVPVYTYALSTTQYGITELIFTVANLLMPLLSVSIADGLLRFGLDTKLKKEEVLKISLLFVMIGSAVSLLCVPLFRLNAILSQWLFYFLLILNLRIYRDVFAIYLKVCDKNKFFALDSILYTFVLCISSVLFLVYYKWGIAGYFGGYICANLVSILFLLWAGRPFKNWPRGVNKTLAYQLLAYSAPMILNALAWWIIQGTSRFALQGLVSVAAVGIYAVAAKIPTLISAFTGVFSQAWIISSVLEYDSEQERAFYTLTFRRYYVFLFIGSIGLTGIIKTFMKLYVSPDFFIAWKYVPLLLASTVCVSVAAFCVGIYAAAKKNVNITLTTLTGAGLNILCCLLLIPWLGVMGAALATFLSWLYIAGIRLWDISRFFPFEVNYKRLILYMSLLLLQSVTVIYVPSVIMWGMSLLLLGILCFMERDLLLPLFQLVRRRIAHAFE